MAECLQPETQAGFRKHRSTRDNIFLLAELMDEVMRAGAKFMIVFIDFVSAFDTVSHHFLDEAMAAVEEGLIAQGRGNEVPKLRKCRTMFRAIYRNASACVRVGSFSDHPWQAQYCGIRLRALFIKPLTHSTSKFAEFAAEFRSVWFSTVQLSLPNRRSFES